MGRSPCCDEVGLKKGPWTPEEDNKLTEYIQKHGHGSWRRLPKLAGLNRCGKSCRLRWTNYLRPDIKRGKFSEEEEKLIVDLHSALGNKWSSIATRLPGRTDNEIKNYWNTHLRKKLLQLGIDPVTHRPRTDLNLLASLPTLIAAANFGNFTNHWDNALKLQADAAQLARLHLAQSLVRVLTTSTTPNMDLMSLLGSSPSLRSNPLGDLLQLNRPFEGLVNGSLELQGSMPALSGLPNLMFQNQLDGGEIAAHAPIDGSSSCELGTESTNGCSTNSSVFPASNSTPSLVSASPENTYLDQTQEQLNSTNISINSPSSAHFDAWESLNLDDLNCDLGWKEILDQMSWPDAS